VSLLSRHQCLAINKELDLFTLKTEAQVREELIKIKGIGNWTIDIYLMFSLQAPDLLPLRM
jgi:DNA-3-methyladenine glycosylase II